MTPNAHWLLLDAGNSALKWALMTPDGRLGPAHGSLRNGPPVAMTAALANEWSGRKEWAVHAAFGCAVAAAAVLQAVQQAVRQAFGLPVRWFEAQPHFEHGGVSLRNGYRNPLQLGVDRWHALIAARAAYPDRPLVVVTAGTATTVDGISAEGRFVGGAIAPGVRLMFESLARGTANLPFAAGTLVALPDNTDDAICSGVIGAQLGLIERFARGFERDHGAALLVLSGGFASRLAPHVGAGTALPAVAREENLVLRGILLRAQALTAAAEARR
jgi:type III pantothenate kinase